MRILKKTADILNAAEDALILALCLILFFAGIYCLADSARLYGAASDRSLLIYRPDPGGTLDSSRLITENQVAWIRIDGTDVDFPVLQGKDNSEYLNKDPYGEFSFSGSIFLDSRCDGGFLDGYSVIYGHHMSGGYMFGCLDRFLEEGYLKSHAKGTKGAEDAFVLH